MSGNLLACVLLQAKYVGTQKHQQNLRFNKETNLNINEEIKYSKCAKSYPHVCICNSSFFPLMKIYVVRFKTKNYIQYNGPIKSHFIRITILKLDYFLNHIKSTIKVYCINCSYDLFVKFNRYSYSDIVIYLMKLDFFN